MTIVSQSGRRAVAALVPAMVAMTIVGPAASAEPEAEPFTAEFRLRDCRFTTYGRNPHFLLQPGHWVVLEGDDDGTQVRVAIEVLHRTKAVRLDGIGLVRTRVIEEREWKNGALVEVSQNYFANCMPTNDVFYFGEEVDIYRPDGTITHDGSWVAGVDGARPGMIMPGTFLLGSRYFQELAPEVAMDRAEHVESGLALDTEAGRFRECVRIVETTPLEPGAESEKIYCPGVGLAADGDAELVEVGFRHEDDD